MGSHHDTEGKIRSSADMFNEITKLLEADGGSFQLSFNTEGEEWLAALVWGQEAPDSPMAAAAAYGVDRVPAAAVEKALREAGR